MMLSFLLGVNWILVNWIWEFDIGIVGGFGVIWYGDATIIPSPSCCSAGVIWRKYFFAYDSVWMYFIVEFLKEFDSIIAIV